MKSIQTNTTNLLNGKSLKLNIMPSYFCKYEASKCRALMKAETFNPHKVVVKREENIINIFEQYELVSRTNTGLSIVRCPEDGTIYLYGAVDEDCEYDEEYEGSKFKVVTTDWTSKNEKKHHLLYVAENINLFVDECLE